jgi:hypothetical protein
MKILKSCIVSAIALTAAASAHAADAAKANVSWVFTDIVAPAEQQAYEAAIKSFNKCLGQHGLKVGWTAYTHETGDTYKYSYVAGPMTWADVDTIRAVGKPCQDVWRAEGNAHLKSETSSFLTEAADMSHMPKDKEAPGLLSVVYFTVKNSREAEDAFTDGAKKITAAADKAKWMGHFTLYKTKGGDKGSPDYILISPYKNFAAYGAGADPTVWKMVEGVSGKQEADALRKSFNDSIEDSSAHVDAYSADLTYTPAK